MRIAGPFTPPIWDPAFASVTPPSDKKRQTIPGWNTRTLKPARHELISPLARPRIRCDRCPRSRCSASIATTAPAHAFELPDRAVNQAMASGQIAASLPFVKKESVELLKAKRRGTESPQP